MWNFYVILVNPTLVASKFFLFQSSGPIYQFFSELELSVSALMAIFLEFMVIC